jgi:hypothetical protein
MNKFGLKSFSCLLSLWNCHYSFTPATILFVNALSHQRLYFRWPTQETTTTTLRTTIERTTRMSTATAPLPTLDKVLAMQAKMLQTMQQTLINMQADQPQAPPPPLRDRLGDF